MSGDIKNFVEEQKLIILEEKKRLGLFEDKQYEKNCDNETTQNNNLEQSLEENKENVHINPDCVLTSNENQTLPFIEPLNLNSNRDNSNITLEEKKQAFIDKLVNSENSLTNRSDDSIGCAMLRYGEYSPNNPELRVTAAPYLGLGEYEQRRNYFLQKQRAEYLRHIAKKNEGNKELKKTILSEHRTPANISENTNRLEKSVQTDIQNIKSQLIQYDLQCQNSPEKELSPRRVDNNLTQNNRNLASYRIDQRLTTAQNALLNQDMEKPKSILSNRRTGSPRERLMSDLYTPTFMDSFSYQASKSEEHEREKLKQEVYQHELRLQIEEKHRLQQMRVEQERREQELGNRRLEQQLLRMQEERMIEEQRRSRRDEQMRRHSEDLLRRKQELQSTRHGFRKHMNSESSVTSFHSNPGDTVGKPLSHYSPPVSRRNPYSFNIPSTSVFADPSARYNPNRFDSYHRKDTLNRMDSLNSYEPSSRYNTFSRFDSLSRIDSLNQRIESMNIRDSLSNGQRRHSATQQDLSMLKRSPRLQRRSSSSRFEDSLPVPILKAHSPVAKELKNSIPFNSSRHSSDALRKLEDKWQIPAVQKTILNHADSPRDGQKRSILTQLGAIRMQLQQEQLRMDETLRKRGFTQSKAVDFH
ncbi:trichohyalin-like [Anoplophora glabripennis]|uniref:trichohyalin-like n=1 Tax=Anoplophora glabripennis TaxID=217634 RepID=UPI0008739432|nr:trichohyalin-like [Anoplophora glabripennis]